MKFDNRVTELIAVGASVGANCQSCVEYHFAKATECGVERDEIAQAVEVGRMVRRGAAGKVDKTAEGLLRQEPAPAPAAGATSAATEGCGCGA